MKQITQDCIKKILHYENTTGIFKWIVKVVGRNIGDIAGTVNKDGYVQISIKSKLYSAHRLAYIYVHGDQKEDFYIDHINHNRSDNRIENLRACTRSQNCRNQNISKRNKTGFNGVSYRKSIGSYIVQITLNNKNVYLGSYKNIEEAIEVRKAANIKYGFHENHGSKTV